MTNRIQTALFISLNYNNAAGISDRKTGLSIFTPLHIRVAQKMLQYRCAAQFLHFTFAQVLLRCNTYLIRRKEIATTLAAEGFGLNKINFA